MASRDPPEDAGLLSGIGRVGVLALVRQRLTSWPEITEPLSKTP